MNKVMKFCGSCEEAFADRFSFCPNCGGGLETFEMNPISPKAAAPQNETPPTPSVLAEPAEVLDIPAARSAAPVKPAATEQSAPSVPSAPSAPSANVTREFSLPDEPAETSFNVVPETKVFTAPTVVPAAAAVTTTAKNADAAGGATRSSVTSMTGGSNNGWREVKSVSKNDGDFHVTMFESHTFLNDPRLRAAGLLGIVLVIGVLTGAFVYDLFQQQVYVAIPEGNELVLSAYIPTDDPSEIPEVEKMKIDNRKGEVEGGGGGGGRKDPLPASEGRQAPMFKDPPLLTPSKEDISVTDPAMKVFRGNQGPKDVIPPPDSRPMGAGVSKIPSDGSGGPLGQGSGDGSGQGPGRGPGYGPGSNGGAGGGDSGLLGGPRGGGGGGEDDPPKMNAGPSKPFRITSQQKPAYTEEARKAQINGTVRLRVTFNSNGTIGAITPVNQLGYGLTEKAIAAARAIRFEPALKNGVPVTTSKVLEFNFNIY